MNLTMNVMKRLGASVPMAMIVGCLLTLQADAQEMENLTDSASYAVGYNYAVQELMPVLNQLRGMGLPLDAEIVAQAVADVIIEGEPVEMPDSVVQATLVEFQKLHMAAIAQSVQAQGEAFLAENAKKDGVTVTESGLQYTRITEGTGATPDANDSVQVRYRGFLLNGDVFDERWDAEGVTFRLDGVIQGWIEGLQLMKEGAQVRFFIPSTLAYGPRSMGSKIRPNETLVFDVELLRVVSND